MTGGRPAQIIKLVDWFETPESLFIVMELALGGELFGRISQHGAFTDRDGAAAFRQILEAIGHMHMRGLVHCDLKPENILIKPSGSVVLVDPALRADERDVITTTPHYNPLLLRDAKADVMAIGVMLYEILTGVLPIQSLGSRCWLLGAQQNERPAHQLT